MNKLKDSHLILIGLLFALAALVTISAITQGKGADAETQKALSYAVVGLVGALGGASRRDR